MSKRITPKWTKTTKEAFGNNEYTDKGLEAEKLIFEYLEEFYDEVIWHENNREKQVAGIDFEFKKNEWKNYYSVDVKGNLKNKCIYVYPEEISKKKNHRMIHVDLNEGRAVEYDRSAMVRYLSNHTPQIDKNGKKYIKIFIYDKELRNNIEYYRTFFLKNFKAPKKDISKILDKYNFPEV